MNCSIAEPCYKPDCEACTPAASKPYHAQQSLDFYRRSLSQIYNAKREAYTGLQRHETFPRDPATVWDGNHYANT